MGIAHSYIVGRQVMSRTLIHPAIRVPIVKITSAIVTPNDYDVKEIVCNYAYANVKHRAKLSTFRRVKSVS